MNSSASDEDLVFDESRFRSDNGDVDLFQWLRGLDFALEKLPKTVIQARFNAVEGVLVKLATGSPGLPYPSRPIRHALARSLVKLYVRAESRTLYDTLQTLLKTTSDTNVKSAENDIRLCTLYCMGELMSAFGPQVMSVTADFVAVALKISKTTSNAVILRYHAALSISKVIQASAKAIPESAVKDLVKTFRQGVADKAPAIQRVSSDILAGVQKHLGQSTMQEVDSIVNLCLRNMESADHTTRRHFAEVIGALLYSLLTEGGGTKESPLKSERKGPTDDDESAIPDSARPPSSVISLQFVLCQLSGVFNRSSTMHRTRVGIIQCYAALLNVLGPTYVEANYSILARHLLVEIIPHPRNRGSQHETMRVRRFVGVLLRDLVGVRMLSEQGQIAAIQDLIINYLRKWPALMPGQSAPDPASLVAALKEVSGLLEQLGNAPQFLQIALSSPVLRLLDHPDHSVRVAAAWCLQQFCWVVPRRLMHTAEELARQLNKEVAALLVPASTRETQYKALGQATGLAALFALFPHRHLYVSYDVCSSVLDTAVQLLKRAGEHDLALAAVEAEISWTLIASLMTLGRHFVHPHLSRVLILWRNTLSRAAGKENDDLPPRSSIELAFLLHVRHCALGALLQFLRHNSALLVTLDVARRVGASLTNALHFSNSLGNDGYEEETDTRPVLPHMKATVLELEVMFKQRLFQCFAAFGTSHINEVAQNAILDAVVITFSGPDPYKGSSVQAAIAASSGSFTSIWESNDGYAYGLSSHDWSTDVPRLGLQGGNVEEQRAERGQDAVESAIIRHLQQPVIGSCEYEPLCLLTNVTAENRTWPEPPPPATGMVDAAIDLFTAFLGRQTASNCDRAWTALMNNVRSTRLERNPGRRAAVVMNTVGAMLEALQLADHETREGFASAVLYPNLLDFLKGALSHVDQQLRKTASDAYGLMASRLDTAALTSQVKSLVDQVLSNRDPNSRAGCAMALGSLYASVGGLAAGPLLKTVVNVLMSLGTDPHPLVHYYALQYLSSVIDAASLSYEPHIRSTLGMLAKLYLSESHEPEGRRSSLSAGLSDLPAYAAMCEIADSMVAVLGPELRDSTRLRTLLLAIVQELSCEADEAVVVEAMRCLQHCLMFARDYLDVPSIVLRLRRYLSSSRTPLKSSAVNGLYLLVQKDVLLVSKFGGDQLAEALFAMLDTDASVDGVRAILTSWLSQTVTSNPSAWISLCQKIMAQANNSQQVLKPEAPASLPQDDESESLQVSGDGSSEKGLERRTMGRWRTQLFALQCLHGICTTLAGAGLQEHVDLRYAKSRGLDLSNLLASRVPDLIRMAFTASTAYVTEIRLAGLVVLRDVVEIFADAPDPDVQGALLLEQYQAPIAAALTPAFSTDSTPELLASAVEVCATFIGAGVVDDGSKMGRILKLLTTALDQCSGSGGLMLGEGAQLGPNASVMLRISITSAWAKLAIASAQRTYLADVVRPHRAVLCALWIESIVDYARLKAHSELTAESDELPGTGLSISVLEKDVTLQYYADAWWHIVAAVSSFMEQNDPSLTAPLNGEKWKPPPQVNGYGHSTAGEACSLQPVLLGLAMQLLVEDAPFGSIATVLDEQRVATLHFLSQLLRPKYSGAQPLHSATFGEITVVLYRLALSGSVAILAGVLRAASTLADRYPSSLAIASQNLSNEVSHCLRIIMCALQRLSPATGIFKQDGTSIDTGPLFVLAIETMRHVTQSCDVEIHERTRAVALYVFVEFLRDESSANHTTATSLAALKPLIGWSSDREGDAATHFSRSNQAIHSLLSACIVNIEALGGRQGQEVTVKLQNNMLSAAITLSAAPAESTFSYSLIDQYTSIVARKLMDDNKQISRTALRCVSIMMAAAHSGSATLRASYKLLLPGLVHFIATAVKGPPDVAPDLEEGQRLLNGVLGFVSRDQVVRILCFLLPIHILFLQADTASVSKTASLGVGQLLHLAASYPEAFKDATATLHESTRTRMEAALRQAVAPAVSVIPQQSKRQIALKQF